MLMREMDIATACDALLAAGSRLKNVRWVIEDDAKTPASAFPLVLFRNKLDSNSAARVFLAPEADKKGAFCSVFELFVRQILIADNVQSRTHISTFIRKAGTPDHQF